MSRGTLINRKLEKEYVKVEDLKSFRLYRHTREPNRWQVRLSAYGNYARRRFTAETKEEALELAPVIAGLKSPRSKRRTSMKLLDAFEETFSKSNRRPSSIKDWRYQVYRFLAWIADEYPLISEWGDLDGLILSEYLDTFTGKAHHTRRLAIQPITQTAHYMSRIYDYPLVQCQIGKAPKGETKTVHLVDVLDFLSFVRSHPDHSHYEVGIALQSLAGLQLQEATRLTWDRVRLDIETIEISGEVKNEFRLRAIPVVSYVVGALERAAAYQKRKGFRQDHIQATKMGLFYSGTQYREYSKGVKQAITAWNPKVDWKPKDLRNTLETWSSRSGLRNDIWERYVGHALSNPIAEAYVSKMAKTIHPATRGEEAQLMDDLEVYRKQVIHPLEEAICNFLQLAEQPNGQVANAVNRNYNAANVS